MGHFNIGNGVEAKLKVGARRNIAISAGEI